MAILLIRNWVVKNPHSLEDRAVVLVSPDEDLRDGPERLHQQAAVGLRHCLVAAQDRVQVPRCKKKTKIKKKFQYGNIGMTIFFERELSPRASYCTYVLTCTVNSRYSEYSI